MGTSLVLNADLPYICRSIISPLFQELPLRLLQQLQVSREEKMIPNRRYIKLRLNMIIREEKRRFKERRKTSGTGRSWTGEAMKVLSVEFERVLLKEREKVRYRSLYVSPSQFKFFQTSTHICEYIYIPYRGKQNIRKF